MARDRLEAVLFRAGALLLLGFGAVLRILTWVQNRDLIIDEANIARNLSERGYAGLLRPLDYEQYAPPLFLWAEKTAVLAGGFGEQALRFPALLAGLLSLPLFGAVAKKLLPRAAVLFALALFSTSYLLIRYAAEVKQYGPDVLITLALLFFALRTDPFRYSRLQLFLRWAVAGSVALWASMPAVFVLAGVAVYYALVLLRARRSGYWLALLATVGVWLAQFGAYYFLVLRHQANSAYLQSFHQAYFLHLLPQSTAEWKHNSLRIKELLGNAGSAHYYLMLINCGLIALGVGAAIRKKDPRIALLLVPVVLTLLAAGLRQFSLLDRVALFLVPLLMLLIGSGFGVLLRLQRWPVHVALALFAVLVLWFFNPLLTLRQPVRQFEITRGMDHLLERKVSGGSLYVHHSSVPTYRYYTVLHPGRSRYAPLLGAKLLDWSDDYKQPGLVQTDTAWFLFSGGFPPEEKSKRMAQLEAAMQPFDSLAMETVHVYGFAQRLPAPAGSINPN